METALNHSLVYCGNDCGLCPQFRDGGCGGCRTERVAGFCATCAPRLCARERRLENCGLCAGYPCAKIVDLYAAWRRDGYVAGAVACRDLLDRIKEGAGRA